MIYTITISPAIDYVMHLDDVVVGATNRSTKEELYFGGKGINVSVMLKKMGLDSIALGFIAGFTGKALEEGLREQGIHTDFVHLEKGITRINVKINSTEDSELNGQGALPEEKDLLQLEAKLNAMLKQDDILILSGNVPSPLPTDLYNRFLTIAREKGAHTVVDTNGALLLSTLQYHPFLIKPNKDELFDLFGDIPPLEGAHKLKQQGARNVLVSLGEEGALLLAEDGKTYSCGVPSGTVIHPVGSGDSMVAGFVNGYLNSRDYAHALRLGCAAGSATALSQGIADKGKIQRCFEELTIDIIGSTPC